MPHTMKWLLHTWLLYLANVSASKMYSRFYACIHKSHGCTHVGLCDFSSVVLLLLSFCPLPLVLLHPCHIHDLQVDIVLVSLKWVHKPTNYLLLFRSSLWNKLAFHMNLLQGGFSCWAPFCSPHVLITTSCSGCVEMNLDIWSIYHQPFKIQFLYKHIE